MAKNLYNRREWVLGICTKCGRDNYVEPHGTTAECACTGGMAVGASEWTEHTPIPWEWRDKFSGIQVVNMPRSRKARLARVGEDK